jgi:excisionase family DNA binding protein
MEPPGTPDLRAIARDPSLVSGLPRETLLTLISDCGAAHSVLLAELSAPVAREDRVVSATEAARLLGVSRRWVYAHAHDLGGVRLGPTTIRFSTRALEDYARTRTSRRR